MRDVRSESRRGLRRIWSGAELHVQLEELLIAVWEQERFERTHPFTCAVMREPVGARRLETRLN